MVEVTSSSTTALVWPTPSMAVLVQVTVVPDMVQTGTSAPLAKCAPWGAFPKSTVVAAWTTTVNSRASPRIMPKRFMVKLFFV